MIVPNTVEPPTPRRSEEMLMAGRWFQAAMRLYHNPRCSKSRQALALLEQRGVDVQVVRYLEDGISEEDLRLLVQLDGILRRNAMTVEEKAALDEGTDVAVMLRSNPALLQRPVLIHNGKAVIGRPPEDILALLD